MTTVNTVLGPIDTADLGFTLMHEHIVHQGPLIQNYPELFGPGIMDRIITGINEAREGGVDTIVDATPFDTGRDVNIMAEVSRRTGVNIVACSGWWMKLPDYLAGNTPDLFADLFVRDIEVGVAGTGIKAGIMKYSDDYCGLTPEGEIMLRYIARSNCRTGVQIMLHSYAPQQIARQQLAILQDEGVDMKKVVVGHANDTQDMEYLTWILDQGCYLGMDRFPGSYLSPYARTETMKRLIDDGWADRLLPSHDISMIDPLAFSPPEVRDIMENRNPHGYLYLKKV
ncbi:MAG: hypothetical protein P8105_08545, partial [Dehalococcoidia bacterium]